MFTIDTVDEVTPNEYAMAGSLGEKKISVVVRYSSEDNIERFNLRGDEFALLLFYGGLETEFSRKFFDYRENGEFPLPWHVGEIGDSSLAKAAKALKEIESETKDRDV